MLGSRLFVMIPRTTSHIRPRAMLVDARNGAMA